MSIALPILATTTFLATVILTTHALVKFGRERAHEKPVPIEKLAVLPPDSY